MTDITFRDATPADLALVLAFVRELAEYERLGHEVVATEEDFRRSPFGEAPKAHALIVEKGGRPAGFAVWFYNFSTFLGRPGIYVEDVYVRPEFRGGGIGRMIFRHLAARAVAEGCGRLEWWVLDWNESAIRFYRSIGAVPMDEWTVQRVTGDALARLAGE
ncbi:MAG TPA: GNAT family N-acetyltransferase [Azospirillaceae bacterium]|nr:GNAT family N-acetyltransferase [Azospirillaceae bacterium]